MNKVVVSTLLSGNASSKSNSSELIFEPLFTVKKTKLDLSKLNLSDLQAVIFTSANAVDTIIDLKLGKDLPIFAIGEASARKLRLAGYYNIFYSPQKNANCLKEIILQKLKPNLGRVIYFCGEAITLDFKVELEDYGFKVDKIISYQLTAIKNFSEQFIDKLLNNQIAEIQLYSQNSAELFFTLFKKTTQHYRLSTANIETIKISCLSDKILLKAQNLKKDLPFKMLLVRKMDSKHSIDKPCKRSSGN